MKSGEPHSTKRHLIKVDGSTKELVTVHDKAGNIIHRIVNPIMAEFQNKDVLQIIVGASLLAIPLAYTQETWDLGSELAMMNVFLLIVLSLIFLSSFIFYNYYKSDFETHKSHFFTRLITTYSLAFLIVAVVLTIIGKAPWTSDILLAFKRVVIVTFPASMSAAVADFIK